MDFRPIIIVLLGLGALIWFLLSRGESGLSAEIVTELVDTNDEHFRDGNHLGICGVRARDFTSRETSYRFIDWGAQPSRMEDVEADEASLRSSSNTRDLRSRSFSRTLSRIEYCDRTRNEAEKLQETQRRRSSLAVALDPEGESAQYDASYVLVSPLPEGSEYPKDAEGDIYVYALQDESAVVEIEDGEPVIKSSRITLRSYWMYPRDIPAEDRPAPR
jgi:hypothetical protein